MHKLGAWAIWCIILTVLAGFFKFCLRGYTYISVSLLFIAALIAVNILIKTAAFSLQCQNRSGL